MRIFFIRSHEPVVARLIRRFLDALTKAVLTDPLWPYTSILEEVISPQHLATLDIRNMIEFEEHRENARRLKPQADYPRLHEVARHAITVTEILEVNVRTLDSIVKCHDRFANPNALASATKRELQQTHQRFLFQSHMVYSIRCRCTSYKERIRNEIQQAFNLVAQEDARTSVDIAVATRADSQALTSMAFVTLIFLPPTFISAVFSTTFFDFGSDSDSWKVSNKFWIYWAWVVPTTVIVALIYHRHMLRKSAGNLAPQLLRRRTTALETMELAISNK